MTEQIDWRSAKFRGVDALTGEYHYFFGKYRRDAISPEQIANVSPGFEDDEEEQRFTSIQAAIDYMYSVYGAISDTGDGVVILVHPGKYTEQIHSYAHYYIQGVIDTGITVEPPVILYNTGVDADHYPLRGGNGDRYNINNMMIETDTGGVTGKFGNDNFNNVVFNKGKIIEATQNATAFSTFDNCSSVNTGFFDLTGAGSGGARIMTINDCFFGESTSHWNVDSTHTTTLMIVKNTIFHKSFADIGGNWKAEFSNCHMFNLVAEKTVISTTNKITFLGCILANGLHFTSAPALRMHLNTFNDDCGLAISGADITADATLTDVDYVQNIQQNGLSGDVQITCPVKNVGCGAINKYITIQDAIDSVPVSGAGTVMLYTDLTGLSELTLPANAKIGIDAQRKYSVAFAGDIVELGDNQELTLMRMVSLTGGNIEINGNNSLLDFEGCAYAKAYITLTSGSGAMAILYNSSFEAATGHNAITVNSLDPLIVLGYTRLKGVTGKNPIIYNVLSVNKLKSKFSTIIDADGNAPLANVVGAGKVTLSMYNSALNAVFDPNKFTNLVGSPNLTADANINF